ncbi:unnamed protein product [Thlaspi arvense]|uniref:Polygalacturonase n=1 Tax=Thlaspi arvense TaxID=13288 RepID=A0AAU9T1F2_THLAR|nr:unnamed protein product [Thlaspi arvense]
METILGLSILVNLLCFSFVKSQNYNVLDFGAKGDGQTDDSYAFAKMWNATCGGEESIGKLVIPAGKTFLLQPRVFQGPCRSSSIHIQFDGVIVAPSNKEAWSIPKSQMWIGFSDVTGLAIVGSGTINGRGSSFWEQKVKVSERATALHFSRCDNLTINGITLIDSPKSHISIQVSKTVAISKINISSPESSPNTDGINVHGSTDVNIFDSTIQSGDDCIAISTGSVNINITRINCGPGHGISVGSLGEDGEKAEVSGVQVTHCTFNRTMNGARIKTWPGGEGYARDISFEDITLIDAKNPIIIDQNYIDKGRHGQTDSAVMISNITFVGFRGTSLTKDAMTLDCSPITHCKDVVMDGINITMAGGEKPTVNCQYVDGESSDINLMHDCFKGNTTA